MFFYIGIFIFCVLMLIINNYLKKQKDKKIFEIVTLVILCIISGTRYFLGGTDYSIYQTMFEAVPFLNDFDFSTVQNIYGTFGAEKGYLFICSLIKNLGFNFFGFTLIHSVIFYMCMYIGLKKYTKNFNFLIIIFLYKLFFYNTFISLRQSITIAIFFIAIRFIQERKMIKYFLLCTLAVMFHNGALLLYPVYCVNMFKLTKKRIIILNCIFIPTLLFSFLNIPVLSVFRWVSNLFSSTVSVDKANNLFDNNLGSGINILHTLEYFVIMILMIKNYKDITGKNENAELIIKLFLILLPIFTLLRGYTILTREKDYFTFTYAIILLYLCNIKQKRYYTVIQICTIGICLLGYIKFINFFDNGAMMPYSSYITKEISIMEKKE